MEKVFCYFLIKNWVKIESANSSTLSQLTCSLNSEWNVGFIFMTYRNVLRWVLVVFPIPYIELLNNITDGFLFCNAFQKLWRTSLRETFSILAIHLFLIGRITSFQELWQFHSISSSVLDIRPDFYNFFHIGKIMFICMLSCVIHKNSATVIAKSPLRENNQAERHVFIFYSSHRSFTLS